MIKKFVNLILYCGEEKKDFEKLIPIYSDLNLKYLSVYSAIVMCFFMALGIICIDKKSTFHENMFTYFATSFGMFIIVLFSNYLRFSKKKNIGAVNLLMFFFMIVLYMLSMQITFAHADLPAVTYIGVLLIMPLLFINQPLAIMIFQTFFVIIFCILVKLIKIPEVVGSDIWNALTFLVVSHLSGVVVLRMRIESLMKTLQIEEQNKQILYISTHDPLTGLKNRTAFEEDFKAIKEKYSGNLYCLFVDANGLREINNLQGHEKGDKMLKCVASGLEETFGSTYCYRVGGDEFIVFKEKEESFDIEDQIQKLKERYALNGYYVSVGYSLYNEENADLDIVLQISEKRMYEDKEKYYSNLGVERGIEFKLNS